MTTTATAASSGRGVTATNAIGIPPCSPHRQGPGSESSLPTGRGGQAHGVSQVITAHPDHLGYLPAVLCAIWCGSNPCTAFLRRSGSHVSGNVIVTVNNGMRCPRRCQAQQTRRLRVSCMHHACMRGRPGLQAGESAHSQGCSCAPADAAAAGDGAARECGVYCRHGTVISCEEGTP